MNAPHGNTPYVAQCGFCEQGLLRPMRCRSCQAIVAVCDECELIWDDLRAVHDNPKAPSAGAQPNCPVCDKPQVAWELLTRQETVAAGLGDVLQHDS